MNSMSSSGGWRRRIRARFFRGVVWGLPAARRIEEEAAAAAVAWAAGSAADARSAFGSDQHSTPQFLEPQMELGSMQDLMALTLSELHSAEKQMLMAAPTIMEAA